MYKNQSSAVILAAGNSVRIGRPKFTLNLNQKHTFFEHILMGYEDFGCSKIVLVLNADGVELFNSKYSNYSQRVEVVVNPTPILGRFFSLKLGLQECTLNSPTFIHNVDNPFISKTLLCGLIDNLTGSDFCIPSYNGKGGHPILISEIIKRNILNESKSDYILSDYLKNYTSSYYKTSDGRILLNINTINDYNSMIESGTFS